MTSSQQPRRIKVSSIDETLLALITQYQKEQKRFYIPIKFIRGAFKLKRGEPWHSVVSVTLSQYLMSKRDIYVFKKSEKAGEHCVALTGQFLIEYPEYHVEGVGAVIATSNDSAEGSATTDNSASINPEVERQQMEEKRKQWQQQEEQRRKQEEQRRIQREELLAKEKEQQRLQEQREQQQRKQQEEAEKKRIMQLSLQQQEEIEAKKQQIAKTEPKWVDSEDRRMVKVGGGDQDSLQQSAAQMHKVMGGTEKEATSSTFDPKHLPNIDKKIDNLINNGVLTITDSVENLVQQLTAPAENDAEKVRAFFKWITSSIQYDLKGEYTATSPVDVLRNRHADSVGYCALFQRMCDIANIDCVTLYGWVRGTAQYVDTSTMGHGWNAVRIDSKDNNWQFVDCNFGAGYVNGGEYVHECNEYYFFPRPQTFIYSHLPQEEKWQLLEQPITKEEFDSNVMITVPGFEAAFSPLSHKKRDITLRESNLCQIDFAARDDANFLIKLQYFDTEERIEHHTMLLRPENNRVEAHLIFPEAGRKYYVKIMSRLGSLEGTYLLAAKYIVDVAPGAPISLEANGFPMEMARPHHVKCGIAFESHKYRSIGLEGSNILGMKFRTNGEANLFATVCPVQSDGSLGTKLGPSHTFSQFVDAHHKVVELSALFPSAGEYQLNVFCKHRSQEGNQYHGGIEYRVVVDEAPFEEVTGFPTPLASFMEYNCYLEQPMENPLRVREEPYPVKIHIRGNKSNPSEHVEKVAFVVGGLWNQLSRSDSGDSSLWQCDLEVKEAVEHKCYVKMKDEKNFKCILKWNAV